MIIQTVWAWKPGRLWSVNIMILSSAGGNCWMLWAQQTYHSTYRVNTLICGDSSKPFSLIHDWKVVLLDAYDWLLAENWWCFWDSNSWMLFLLNNRVERTFAVTAAGLCTFWLANSKKFLFRLTTKILFYSLMASFTFLLWHYRLKIPTQESKDIKSGKGLACWKRLTP